MGLYNCLFCGVIYVFLACLLLVVVIFLLFKN